MNKHFLQALKDLRLKRDLSQAFVAQLLSMESSTYGKKENGSSTFSIDEVVALCDYYQVNIADVVYGKTVHNTVAEAAPVYEVQSIPKIDIHLQVTIPDCDRMGITELVKQKLGVK